MKILNKNDMYRLLKCGRLGNTMRMWDSVDDVLKSGYTGIVSLRSMVVGSPIKLYNVPVEELSQVFHQYRLPPTTVILENPAKDNQRVFQGEVCRGLNGLYLIHTTNQGPLRTALEAGHDMASGLIAKMTMQHFVDPYGYDWIDLLLDDFEDCVIEFTTFANNLGMFNTRTIIWEVRNY